ncbi:MAG: regulatory protein FmdB family [Verrucomicrobiales bacterium]|nr:regulatory protein FmdB family [Verrucomicrobiales bacterium]
MPIYEYIAADPEHSCRVCSKGFELMRPIERPPLEVCYLCKNPVRKVISQVNTPKLTKPLSVSDAKSAGFTVMKRRDKGVYEKL